MTLPVAEVFIHHEGAGVPRDDFAFGAPFYTLGIGLTEWHIWRTPETDIATFHHNHISLGVVFSGDRTTHPITDSDLALLTAGMAECRRRGYVVADPFIRPHDAVFVTACPGAKTIERLSAVDAAVLSGTNLTVTPTSEADVKYAIVYPTAPLTTGPFKGLRPTFLGIEGSPILFQLDQEAEAALVPQYGAPIGLPPVFWHDAHGNDNHVYVARDLKS